MQHNEKILIVEDEFIIALDLKNCLEELGYKVCAVVNTGEDAINYVRQNMPDLVLMDIVLNGSMDGIEASKHINSIIDSPIVFITAYSDEDKVNRAKLVMPMGYILKPFRKQDLKITIELALYASKVNNEKKEALKSLSISEKKYRNLFNNALVGLTRTKIDDGTIINANLKTVEIFGFDSISEILNNKTAAEYYVDINLRHEWLAELFNKGEIIDKEAQWIKKDGSRFWVRFTSKLYKEEGYIENVITDISEEKRAVEAFKTSEARFQVVMDNSPLAFYMKDSSRRYIYYNRLFSEIWQIDESEWITKKDDEIMFESKFKEIDTEKYEFLRDDKNRHVETWITPHGETKWLIHNFYIKDEQEIKINATIAMNITQIIQTKKALEDSELKFRQLADVTFEAIAFHDGGYIQYANNQYYEMFGYTPDELTDKQAVEMTIAPESRISVERYMKDNFYGPYEIICQNKNGTKFPVEVQVRERIYEGKNVRAAAIRDITRLKKAEEKYKSIFNNVQVGLFRANIKNGKLVDINLRGAQIFGHENVKICLLYLNFNKLFVDSNVISIFFNQLKFNNRIDNFEAKCIKADNSIFWIRTSVLKIENSDYFEGVVTDITEEKYAADQLEYTLKHLENEIDRRTENLKEANIALKVLLDKREGDKKQLEANIISNINNLVMPYLEKVNSTKSNEKQKKYLNILESNLNEITSSFLTKMTSSYTKLTPVEMQIANMIKLGKSSKEIADILNISVRTIETHRVNIRRKFGIRGKKENLSSLLLSMDDHA